MSEISKFFFDDHNRIRRTFNDYWVTPSNHELAMNVLDTLWIHLTLEVEMVEQTVWGELSDASRGALAAADDQVHKLMEEIDGMSPGDPALTWAMDRLNRAITAHIEAFNTYVVPRFKTRDDQMELGGKAYARWQELFEEKPPRGWTPMARLANSGWGGGGKLANSGW